MLSRQTTYFWYLYILFFTFSMPDSKQTHTSYPYSDIKERLGVNQNNVPKIYKMLDRILIELKQINRTIAKYFSPKLILLYV